MGVAVSAETRAEPDTDLDSSAILAKVLEEICMTPEEELFQELGIEPRDLSSYLAGEVPETYSLHLFGMDLWPLPEEIPGYIYPDSNYWLGLIKQGFERYLELALLGFELKDGVFTVEQIQAKAQRYYAGGKYHNLPFNIRDELPKGWPGLFVRAGKSFARDIGCTQMRLMPAENHPNYHNPKYVPKEEIPALRERMLIKYNGTAKKNGLKREGNWYVCKL